ncbi:uncharacterized protein FTOL_10120 [Fusarium torulosum]|uniref:Uncharacterized protein n=1 Tax=Fusarium torulosum TaxID=33205 RepID=A0AAE8SLL1_9HYPO|nr:uncharacterized protein FTOL_10120 [Fusarium torulosum]
MPKASDKWQRIYQMNGEVTTVVCFDILYGYNGTSMISIYRAHYDNGEIVTKCDMKPVAFHTTNSGGVNRDRELMLNL